MEELLTDQQQADKVKSWMRSNGAYLAAGVILGLGLLFGWNQYQRWELQRAELASDVYESFMTSARAGQVEAAEAQLTAMSGEFGTSPYVDQARLVMARLYLDRSMPDKSAAYLGEVVDKAATPEIRNIARLRLARVLIHQEKYEDALKALPDPGARSFAPAFHDIRGDAYAALGRQAEARSEYEQAMNGEGAEGLVDAAYVQAKLDALGGPAAAPKP